MENNTDLLDERLTQAEIKAAYTEKSVSELNEVVIEQSRRIDRLEKLCAELQDRIAELAEGGLSSPENRRPPHY